jgi:DNA-binding transcriptional ArsR family regulator
MRDGEPGDVRALDSLEALTALGHPDRARLMDVLTVNGLSTTSALAGQTGLATGSVSHHLQVLTRAGLVERAEPGEDRRQRRWRLVTRGYHWSPAQFRDHPAGQATARAAMGVQVDRERDRAQAFVQTATAPWDDAAFSGHYWLRLTPAELAEFGSEIDELMLRWRRREIPRDGAADRVEVLAVARAFPSQP